MPGHHRWETIIISRKTIPVAALVTEVNRLLAIPDEGLHGTGDHPADLDAPGKHREMTRPEVFRMTLASLLEHILTETGQYRGFGYQPGQVTRYATGPGTSPDITDETRRIYYYRAR